MIDTQLWTAAANLEKHKVPFDEAATVFGDPRALNMPDCMKKSNQKAPHRRIEGEEDTMQPEYDFSAAKRGVTAARYAQGSNVVVLDPDVAAVFPNASAVNEALRSLVRVARRTTGAERRRRSA